MVAFDVFAACVSEENRVKPRMVAMIIFIATLAHFFEVCIFEIRVEKTI